MKDVQDWICLRCRSHKLLVWEPIKSLPNEHLPSGSEKVQDGRHFAIHCAYLGRRVEWPSHLQSCGAFALPEATEKQ